MNSTNIESGKDDDDLLIGSAHAVARDEDDVIELEDEDILAEELEPDEGDLDFEPDYDRDY
jgi:hypothetical protein